MPKRLIWRNRRPFQNAVVATAPVCGALMIAMEVRPPVVEVAMPDPVRIGWEAGLIVAGLVGIAGLLWPGRCSTRLGMELASMLMLGTVTGMYAVALAVISGRTAVAATSFIAAVAIGSWWRAGELLGELRGMVESQRSPTDVVGGFP
ncbi:hypothetical protein [Micromonospora sp. NPDC126480]|uniref:hypothetical protein n=1 Tax=Micromonospora sp. NPDC126480 TaxID=3155312 RepID=UPI0033230814